MLLKYLFKFVETRDHPLNPVLSGYFAKLLVLLINRKQKQIVPFIFSEECSLIDNLLYHVYQKSISEVLNKILNVTNQNYDETLSKRIREMQQKAVVTLIDKLAADQIDEEANLNASIVLCENIDQKDFFNALAKKSVQNTLFEIIHAKNNDKSSKCAAMVVYSKYIYQYKNGKEDNDSEKGGDDDDDIIIKDESDSEEEKNGLKDNGFFEVLAAHIEPM